MLALYHVLLGLEMLDEHFTVVFLIFILLAFFSGLRDLNSQHSWWSFAVYLEQLYLLKHDFSVILLAPMATRNETIPVRLDNCHHHDVCNGYEDDAHS